VSAAELVRREPRLTAFYGFIGVAFLVLLGQLWHIQIAAGDQYRQRADVNRIRVVTEKPPRGVIYDRAGRQVVRNVSSFTASVRPADLPKGKDEQQQVLARLAALIDMPVEEVHAAVDEARGDPFTPAPVKSQITREQALVLEEQHTNLPGVVVQVTPIRAYPEGPALGQILGYTGRVPGNLLDSLLEQGYERDDTLGLAGIEASYEEELRGGPGKKQVEVDAMGRETAELETLVPVRPGGNLVLTVDSLFQQRAADILQQAMVKAHSDQASLVAIQPKTGDVLAMVSLPQYDNNLFAAGISQADFKRLNDDPGTPLLNKAIAGLYPPGSTFKLVTAAAALQDKVVTPQTNINCPGSISLPGGQFTKLDWWLPGHGNVNARQAVAVSCDIYFYNVAGGNPNTKFAGLKRGRLAEYAHLFGFAEKSGIRLPGEEAGLIPTEEWKQQKKGEPWYIGDDWNIGIGQGDDLVTPLQLANMTAAIANGGTLYRPRLVSAVRDGEGQVTQQYAPEMIRKLPIQPEYLAAIRAGMRDAVAAQFATPTQSGTAYFALRGYTLPIAGKTGTAEFFGPRDSKGNLPTHALFVGYAPYDDPQIAVAVVVYGGGEGSEIAAPAAAEIMKTYFETVSS
jgi:penicillin-binding protein 2